MHHRTAIFALALLWACGGDDNSSSTGTSSTYWVLNVHGTDVSSMSTAGDAQAAILLAVVTRGAADFGGGTAIGGADAASYGLVVAKYSSARAHQWSHAYTGGAGAGTIVRLAADPTGDVVVLVSGLEGPIDFGQGPLEGNAVLRLTPSGDVRWSRALGTAERAVVAHDVAVDPDGDVLVVGAARELVDENGAALPAPGAEKLWAVKLAVTDGATVFESAIASANGEARAARLGAGPTGDLFVTGTFTGTLLLNASLDGTASTTPSLFVGRLRAEDGAAAWGKRFAPRGEPLAPALAVDGSGDLALSGMFEDPGDATDDNDPAQAIVVKLNGRDGTRAWRTVFAGQGTVRPGEIAFTRLGAVVAAGEFRGLANFGTASIAGPPNKDGMYLTRSDGTNGAVGWTKWASASQGGDATVADVEALADDAIIGSGTFATAAPVGETPRHEIFVLRIIP